MSADHLYIRSETNESTLHNAGCCHHFHAFCHWHMASSCKRVLACETVPNKLNLNIY